ncbi:MAG: hypothetical protein J3Q66DRAFT_339260 [Benniella sp.]|nr:MAG: hypothetical protein J3Q66DRAFT_362601 [Benniella sp.]KAK3817212.1 MAG: hypothetical protein J3Q66DRAFT_339260 [Benniella sp.]
MDRKIMNVTCTDRIKTRALLTLLSSLPSSTSLPCHPKCSEPTLGMVSDQKKSVFCSMHPSRRVCSYHRTWGPSYPL